ncbi:GNAT family N-acetyltransferase [Pokkaliibacter plantistimulans]|uniref:GNAT family N-acetyltransferase n=1 Tax=Proteobacteria bacterium 228 TaxID=2083153 RepID=A0A2S5KLL6_9PROT|nr:GNAT family N-acetyltransferase [Pokkaliibacter plantistimulans]PPC75206.1 GNAT family N-acetyltransferase [Pokkaliibacter plantistimulans]
MKELAAAAEAVVIEELTAEQGLARLDELADILHACVLDGASVGFVLPFSIEQAKRFWLGQSQSWRSGGRLLLVARQGQRLVAVVQLGIDTPPNGSHRAEVTKLLVHPSARRLGIARRLMEEVEWLARRQQRSLLILDTCSGSTAEGLYRSLGYELAGQVPGYAQSIHGVPEATSVMYRMLPSVPISAPV